MADQIIFQIDAVPTLKALQDIKKEIISAKESVEQAKSKFGEYSEEALRAEVKVNALVKEQRSLTNAANQQVLALEKVTKTTRENIEAGNANKNSIDQNRKAYNSLYNEYIRADEATRKKLLPAIIEVDKALKEQESQIGDTRRNVGNYKEAFVGAFQQISSGIPALKGFQAAQQGVNMVMSANPIGGLIMLFLAFKEILGGNAEFADMFSFAMEAVNKVVQSAVDLFADGVKQLSFLGNAFKDPIGTIKQLGEIIANNLLNRFKALGGFIEAISLAFQGEWAKAAKQATNSALQLTTGVEGLGDRFANAAKEGYNAAKALDEFTVTNAKTKAAIKDNQIQIEALTKSLKDRTKSEQERIKIANTIADLEIKNTQLTKKLAEDELKAENLKLKGKTLSAEEEAKLIELKSNVRQADAERSIAEAQRQTRINILLDKERKESLTKTLSESEDEQKKYYESIAKLEQEYILSERDRIKQSYDEKLNAIIGNSEREKNLRLAIQTAQQKALDDFDAAQKKKQVQSEQDKINQLISLDKQRYDNAIAQAELEITDQEELARRKLEIQLDYLNRQLDFAKQLALADGEMTDSEIANIEKLKLSIQGIQNQIANPPEGKVNFGEALGIDKESVEEINSNLNDIGQITESFSGLVNTIYEARRTEIESTKQTEIQAIEESGLSEEEKQKKIAETNKKYALQEYELQKKQFEINKAISIVQAVIAGAQAVVAQLANPTPYVGFILAGLAAATTAAQIAVISAQKPPAPPKFATGVIGLDGAGNETSDSIDAKLSRGESVITAKATKRFAPILAQMELSVGNKPNWQLGNRKFATGFIPSGDGGFSSRYLASDAQQIQNTKAIVTEAVNNAPAPVLQYSEFERFTTSREKSISISEL